MSTLSAFPSVDPYTCDRIIRVSCTKMMQSRYEKGGAKLHKNLLILHLLKKARDEQRKIELCESTMFICQEHEEEQDEDDFLDDECSEPPLEFSVKDDEEGVLDHDAPLIFATEATEIEMVEEPQALSSDLNDALARIGASPADRKRKPSISRNLPQKKTCKPDTATIRVSVICK